MTGTDKNGLNPARGDRPSCMPGGDYFEPKALPDALPQVMNSPHNCSYGLYGVPLSRGEAQPQDDYIDGWADMKMKFDSTPGMK